MDQRQTFEMADRRRARTQIDELKRNCEQYVRERDTLSKKLGELHHIVDKLIDEKKMNMYDPSWKIDLKPYSNVVPTEFTKSSHTQNHHRDDQIPISSISKNNDLIINNNFDNTSLFHRHHPNREQMIPSQKTPSDAFKIKLFHCLQEIEQKAEEISKLSEHLYP